MIDHIINAIENSDRGAFQEKPKARCRRHIKVMLAVMREPTEAVVEAGIAELEVNDVWRAMIDAIIKEDEP